MTCSLCQTIDSGDVTTCGACLQGSDGADWRLAVATVVRFTIPHLEEADPTVRESILSTACTAFVEQGGEVHRIGERTEGLAVFLDEDALEDAVTAAMVSCSEASATLRNEPNPEWADVANVLELRAGIATGSMA
ncbi:MAG: hypothetical protein QF464_16545, partial [Myxococcota bacterium]|nr:hypothetical protein [Myxococcota bacterium]